MLDSMRPEQTTAPWTVVLSDIHLADAQLPDPKRPLWKRFKNPELFIDESFGRMLDDLSEQAEKASLRIELVLNGDTFDFDSIVALPEPSTFNISWLERHRGLDSEQAKSVFKANVIAETHPVWFEALDRFLAKGHDVVFVVGNHDVELHWPGVQDVFRKALSQGSEDQIRFCEWFYISNSDTVIEHGNQYDPYCLCSDPVWPLISKGGTLHVRTPFGNVAGRLMLNGMGLFNPNVDSSFIKSPKDYLLFFFRYIVTSQPLLPLTWFWSAITTLVVSLRQGLLPAQKDPFVLESRLAGISERSNASPAITRALRVLHVHPGIYNPIGILRELWLDRAILFAALVWASVQLFAFVNILSPISVWWVFLPLFVFFPFFLFYARSVRSNVGAGEKRALELAHQVCRIAGVERMVFGHTHNLLQIQSEGVEVFNTGTWSPAYHDVECTQPYGQRCVVSIRPSANGPRSARLLEWKDPGLVAASATVRPEEEALRPLVPQAE